jgi:hypothetical protein
VNSGEALSATDSVVEEVKEEDESINSTSLEVACPKTTKGDFFSLWYGELFSYEKARKGNDERRSERTTWFETEIF